ncbi:MAG: hypothetical protein ACRENL_03860 [Candidatus Dormibacteria bacterium]
MIVSESHSAGLLSGGWVFIMLMYRREAGESVPSKPGALGLEGFAA